MFAVEAICPIQKVDFRIGLNFFILRKNKLQIVG